MAQGYGISEEIIGRWLAKSGRRDDIVLPNDVHGGLKCAAASK
jgi:aryl-alcohol dehydrogenase-like predicted oxidoreductase